MLIKSDSNRWFGRNSKKPAFNFQNSTFNYRLVVLFLLLFVLFGVAAAGAQSIPIPTVTLGVGNATETGQVSTALQIILILTVLSLAPAILILVTSFTRIVIVLSFIRQAMGTQQMPPNQVLVGLALFLTFFIMAPVFGQIHKDAVQPYLNEDISQEAALEKVLEPLRTFMVKQTREKDLGMFVHLAKFTKPQNIADVPIYIIVPAFIISELRIAFQIGFMIYIPFIVIDMVVASILMSMGMMMLPPIMISLPFKIMLFVLIDGWYLLVDSIVKGFV